MIRRETAHDWLLVTHPDHAALAAVFAEAWGNPRFDAPEPFAPVAYAVRHHDDGWLARDATPHLTAAGKPEAFTRDLVGTYAAFEEIDLPSYLKVREAATAAVTAVDPAAGVLVSMHTLNLLTEQADLSTLRPEHRPVHAAFVASQRAAQQATVSRLALTPAFLQRGFEFLQCCDNLSLIVCAGYDQPRALRHRHPDHNGTLHTLECRPEGPDTWSVRPWPFRGSELSTAVPIRRIPKSATGNLATFRAAFATATIESIPVTLRA